MPKDEIQIDCPPSSDAHKIRDRLPSERESKGLVVQTDSDDFYYIGTPEGRYKIHTQKITDIVISGSTNPRILSSTFMLKNQPGLYNKKLYDQFNALCIAYLNGETPQSMRKRPDAIFSNATPTQRNQAIALIDHVGFYNGLKAVRKIVMS